jgi:hypothetical protein
VKSDTPFALFLPREVTLLTVSSMPLLGGVAMTLIASPIDMLARQLSGCHSRQTIDVYRNSRGAIRHFPIREAFYPARFAKQVSNLLLIKEVLSESLLARMKRKTLSRSKSKNKRHALTT